MPTRRPGLSRSDAGRLDNLAQQSLRAVLSLCNARQMTSPEACVTFSPERFTQDGEVIDESTAAFLKSYLAGFRDHIVRVLTVLPRP